MMLPNSRIYVAGHTGLVGSAVTRALHEKGYNNLVLKTHGELDLTDQSAVESFFKKESPEYVVLAAARVGGIMANTSYRADFIFNNQIIQCNVIHFAWKYGVKKLLFLGSTCIYPGKAPQPLKEDSLLSSSLEHTNEPYAVAKIAGLKLCESYNLQYRTNFISVMPTNLYGPGDNYNLEGSHVLPALMRKFIIGKWLEEGNWNMIRADLKKYPVSNISWESDENNILTELAKYGIVMYPNGSDFMHLNDTTAGVSGKDHVVVTVWGTGSPLREFMYSDDMAEACVFILEKVDINDITSIHSAKNSEREYFPPHFINIGTGVEITIKDLSSRIKDITGFSGVVIFDPSKPDGTMRKVTDSSALRKLGFTPKTDLTEGLLKVYKQYVLE
jgi:GDP-L-fucose synthase